MNTLATNEQWLNFYHLQGRDHQQRSLEDVWTMTFDELERHHDFIQWLFPLPEPSNVNPLAPLLTAELIESIFLSKELQKNLLHSFDTMAVFWGISRRSDHTLVRSGQFELQSKKWCCFSNHNQLRLTRVLKCLSLTGHEDLAASLCDFLLSEIDRAGFSFSQISSVTYWMNAVESIETLELTIDDFNTGGNA